MVAIEELAAFLNALSHHHRVHIIQELRNGEMDVNSLRTALKASQSSVSQHLKVLRSRQLIIERHAGRHVYYRLAQPAIAQWLLDGMRFIEGDVGRVERVRTSVKKAHSLWSETVSSKRNK